MTEKTTTKEAPPVPKNHSIDWAFIRQLEGFELEGYIPFDPDGNLNSGVTIASGFDLAHTSLDFLNSLNITTVLRNKLKPYIGLQRRAAAKKLTLHPLLITNEEAENLNTEVKNKYAKKLINWYNKQNPSKPFETLPSAVQTVVASLHFHYGSINRTPRFKKSLLDTNWEMMYNELMNFGDDYTTRRQTEAKYLKQKFLDTLKT